MKEFDIEEAEQFFSDLYFGKHHIPSKITEYGFGWSVFDSRMSMATYDFNNLTRLVVMAHDRCIRAEILPAGPRGIRIVIHKRERTSDSMSRRHPRLEEAIEFIRGQEATKYPPQGEAWGQNTPGNA